MSRLSLPLSALRRPLAARSGVKAATPGKRFASSSAGPSRRYVSTTLLIGGGVLAVAYYYDSRSLVHEHVAMPLIRYMLDPEEGHKLAVRMLGWDKWARPRDMGVDTPELQAELFGLPISNPVGIAAGFDKDADAIDGLFDLGFGYVEVGSVTPEPQPGNPKPRFFRLEEDSAAINRYGFNSLGHGHTLGRLRARLYAFARSNPSHFPSPLPNNPLPPADLPRSLRPGQLLAVNLGKNKTSAADSNEDYVKGVRTLGPYADVVVINVSSPNTPGLRALQGREILQRLLSEVVQERNKIASPGGLPKIAVKVASDLSEDELADVASAVRGSGVEGVIVSNTTLKRKELNLASDKQDEVGGLSGKPLFPYALQALKTLRPLLPPSIPLIGCGGISTGSDALAMADAGASLVQIYTSFGYRGVGTPRLIKDEIASGLAANRSTWKAEVGKHWQSTGLAMGWDERRLAQESEAVRKEAQGLGDLLRQLDQKEGMATLVAEAEQALGLVQAAVHGEAGEAQGGARDNLAGAAPTSASASVTAGGGEAPDVVGGLIEAGSSGPSPDSAAPVPAGLLDAAPTAPAQTAQEQIGAPSIQEAMLSTPVAIDLSSHVVLDDSSKSAEMSDPVANTQIPVDQVDERDDQWVQAVREGQRRLV
ncbi:dihydroorotate dehydrogenase (fumarate) [Kwoniella sp. DSM 27419]